MVSPEKSLIFLFIHKRISCSFNAGQGQIAAMKAEENSSSWFSISATGIESPTPAGIEFQCPAAIAHRPNRELVTAPVSHQKRPHRNATNAIERRRKRSKINEADRYSAAHNGLVAGSSPAAHIGKSPALDF
ncbi:hypothetical protein [Bradyrhizobium sp. 170]|uniref:hypothetical protein n=1 Tax=Bradyrhizobium sp. 170 TaxID=2782641 RepID=UPI001FFF3AF5|nr:hypothetical protein [Bradyrhizobium sp. 170]UPK06965.1 hypothetical protein IVB05_16370 [Bradyrhizobium sp. 170]